MGADEDDLFWFKYYAENPDASSPVGFYRTDLKEDILSSLEALCLSLKSTKKSQRAWKWVILSADMMVTSSLVLFNTGPANVGALVEADQRKQWSMLNGLSEESRKPFVFGKVEFLQKLLDISVSENPFRASDPLILREEDMKLVKSLHENLRNDLTHFKPYSWSIELSGIPDRISAALEITETVMKSPGMYWSTSDQEDDFSRLLTRARQCIAAVQQRLQSERT